MTRNESAEASKHPGKYEGSPEYTAYFMECAEMDGNPESFNIGDAWHAMIPVQPGDVAIFPELAGVECIHLMEDGQGFVTSEECTAEEWAYFAEECTMEENADAFAGYDNE